MCRIGQNLRFSIPVAVRRRLAAASRFLTSRVCHGNGANVLRKVLQISDETLIWGSSCLITCDSEYPRLRQSGRSIHTGPDATMLICSARRRQTTSNEPDRLRLLPMAWARDEMRSELPTKRSRKSRQWSFQPAAIHAYGIVDGRRASRKLVPEEASGVPPESPQIPGKLVFLASKYLCLQREAAMSRSAVDRTLVASVKSPAYERRVRRFNGWGSPLKIQHRPLMQLRKGKFGWSPT